MEEITSIIGKQGEGKSPTAYLVLAVRLRKFGIVSSLITKGVSIYSSDETGRCALTEAEIGEDTDMLMYLNNSMKHISMDMYGQK